MTNLMRFNPALDFHRMQREIDRVFESLSPLRSNGNGEWETAVWSPSVDLVENENAYLIHADLPGVSKEDLKINFHDGALSLSGERKVEKREEKDEYVRIERSSGHFYRSFNLPKTIDVDGIEARHENGVLTIRVPKAEESKPRQIRVA